MGIREALAKPNSLAMPAAIVATLLGIFLVVYNTQSSIPSTSARAYYTDDDGKTYFADDITRIYPFDHDGKQAYLANVFKCNNSQAFVGYLTRIDDTARSQLQKMQSSPEGTHSQDYARLLNSSIEVRRPGEKVWVKVGTPAYLKVLDFPCPNGGTDPHSVNP